MNIFYISKYAKPPTYGNATRQYILSKYMNGGDIKVSLIYSRSNGEKHPLSLKLYQKHISENLECIRMNGLSLKQYGFNLRRIFTWLQFELHLFLYFLLLPKSKRPDVVIASSLSLLTFYTTAVLKKLYKFKLVLEVRDVWPMTIVETGKFKHNSIFAKMLRKIERYGYKHADKIYSTMPRFDKHLEKEGFLNKIFTCIPMGFDNDIASKIELKYYSNKKFKVIYGGAIGHVNYVEELCKAAEILKQENIEFTIYGNGPLKEELINTYQHLPNLSFYEKVPRSEVVNVFMTADLLVNMWGDYKMYDYGVSPNKWMDYMLAAKPILVSYNGYQSIINEAHCGWFIEANNPERMAEKILEISKMPSGELDRIGMNGREYALKHHDYKVLAKELLEFIVEG